MIYLVTNQPQFVIDDLYQMASPREALSWLEQLSEICLDVETTGFDPHTEQLLTLQLGNNERQYVIDAGAVNIVMFKQLLENRLIIGHHLKFDLKFLFKKGIYPRRIYDTFIAERILYCGLPSVRGGLDYVTERYLGFKLDKSVRANIKAEGLTNRVIKYAADDIAHLTHIRQLQLLELIAKGLRGTANLENRYVPVLAYIEYCGFYLDVHKWQAKMQKDRAELKESEDTLNNWLLASDLTGYVSPQLSLFETATLTVNWASPQQVVEIFEEIGINCTVETGGTKKKSVEAPILEKQINISSIIPLYLRYKKAQKVVSTYGQTFIDQINSDTGRIHTSFTQIMDTGRISSGGRNKATGEVYVNFQNIPSDKQTRACFCAQPGNVLVLCDYSGQEQVVLANKSLDPNLLKFYDEGLGDMHSFVASQMYPELKNLSLKEIKEYHSEKRSKAKEAGFAINYGGDGNTIADNLGISKEEGSRIFDSYFEAFPGLKVYFEGAKKQSLDQGYILISEVTYRKSFLPNYPRYQELNQQLTREFWDEYRREKVLRSDRYMEMRKLVSDYFYNRGEIERKTLNYPIQGSAAEITKISGIYIYDWIVDNDLFNIVRFCNTIHDENVLECPAPMGQVVADQVGDAMVRAGQIYCKRVPLKAEPEISTFWKK